MSGGARTEKIQGDAGRRAPSGSRGMTIRPAPPPMAPDEIAQRARNAELTAAGVARWYAAQRAGLKAGARPAPAAPARTTPVTAPAARPRARLTAAERRAIWKASARAAHTARAAFALAHPFGLTRCEHRLVAAILTLQDAGAAATRPALAQLGIRPGALHSQVSKARAKMAAHGVALSSDGWRGAWRLAFAGDAEARLRAVDACGAAS